MKSFVVYLALFLAGALIILAVSFLAPLPVPYYQDFSVMYFSVKGLLAGIPIYDYPAQLEFVKGITPAGFSFHPYPYPPWYALSTFYLGFLSIQVAARAWFLMNITMLSLSAWLLTPGWKAPWRILACLAAILFYPAFGDSAKLFNFTNQIRRYIYFNHAGAAAESHGRVYFH